MAKGRKMKWAEMTLETAALCQACACLHDDKACMRRRNMAYMEKGVWDCFMPPDVLGVSDEQGED